MRMTRIQPRLQKTNQARKETTKTKNFIHTTENTDLLSDVNKTCRTDTSQRYNNHRHTSKEKYKLRPSLYNEL